MAANVLFLIDTLQTGGAEKSLLEIVSRFKKYNPIVCHIFPGDALKGEYEKKGIPVVSLNTRGKRNYDEAIQKLLVIVKDTKPVIIHSTLYRSDQVSRKLKALTGIKLINSFVNNNYSKARYSQLPVIDRIKLFYYQMLDRLTVGAVDWFVSNSNAIKDTNASALGLNPSKIQTIYRGRDFDKIQAVDDSNVKSIETKFNVQEKTVFLNVSRLVGRKGQLDMIRAFKKVSDQQHDVILFIAGEGPFRGQLESEIQRLDLGDKVFLLGNRNDVIDLLFLADCFVFPSVYEGLPGALIEAMMSGKIIIASDIPENRECVDKDSALLYRSGDVGELSTLMAAVANAADSYAHLGMQAKLKSKEKFDLDRIALQYEKVYDNLMT